MNQVHIDEDLFNALEFMVSLGGLVSYLECVALCPDDSPQTRAFHKLIGYANERKLPFAEYLNLFYNVLSLAHKTADEQGISEEINIFDRFDSERGRCLRPIYDTFRMDESKRRNIDSLLIGDIREHVRVCPDCLEKYATLLEGWQKYTTSESELLNLFSKPEV